MEFSEPASLRAELAALRAEQGVALRHANELKERGAPDHEANAAMQHVMKLVAQINSLERRLRDLQLH